MAGSVDVSAMMSHTWTDDTGIVYTRPERADYSSDVDWMRAVCRWNDMRVNVGNKAFAGAFLRGLK